MNSYINIIENDKASGLLKKMYEEFDGKMANILKVHSLNPQSLRAHLDYYRVLMFKPSPLSKKMREMIATVVSSTNECFY
jgi:alkylhydroperoxidase family enzyme